MRKVLLLMMGCLVLAGCLSSGDRPLQLLSGAGATYPPEARTQGLEGFVVVRYDVDATGRVVNLSVVEADPPGIFDGAALEAVAAWQYSPRQVNGQPQAVRGITSRVSFKLGDGEAYQEY